MAWTPIVPGSTTPDDSGSWSASQPRPDRINVAAEAKKAEVEAMLRKQDIFAQRLLSCVIATAIVMALACLAAGIGVFMWGWRVLFG